MIDNPPFRLKILKSMTAQIKTITPANGFQSDLSDTAMAKRVVRGRLLLGDDEPDTMVSIIEPPSSVEQVAQKASDNVKRSTEWDIMIQGWKKNSCDPADEPCDPAYVLAAEIMQVLAAEKARTLGPQSDYIFGFREIENMTIGSPVVRPAEQLTNYGQLYLILTLKFVEDTALPFG